MQDNDSFMKCMFRRVCFPRIACVFIETPLDVREAKKITHVYARGED